MKIRSLPLSDNFRRKLDLQLPSRFLSLDRFGKRAESLLRHGLLKVIATLHNLSATLAKWSGRHDPSSAS